MKNKKMALMMSCMGIQLCEVTAIQKDGFALIKDTCNSPERTGTPCLLYPASRKNINVILKYFNDPEKLKKHREEFSKSFWDSLPRVERKKDE